MFLSLLGDGLDCKEAWFSFAGCGLVAVALPGCAPGRALTFLASPRKVSKRRRAGFVDPPLRYGHAALLGPCGVRANSLRSNMRAP